MTDRSTPSRRGVLAALTGLPVALALPLGGCIVTGDPPLPVRRFRALRVDTSPIADRGLPNWAARVAAAAEPPLRRAFVDRIDPGDARAPVLTVQISSVTLTAYAGGSSSHSHLFHGSGNDARDWIEGALLVPAHADLPDLRRPLMTSLPSAQTGAWYLADNEQRRLEAVCGIFAIWARREFVE